MTIDEAIKMLEKAKHHNITIFDMDYYYEALDMAIDELKYLQSYYDTFVDFKNIERGYECQWISDANLGKN